MKLSLSLVRHAIRASLLVTAGLLTACGGGGLDGAPSSSPAPAPAPAPGPGTDPTPVGVQAPVLTLTPTAIKTFRFTWADVSGETGYRLLEDPDGTSGYTPVTPLPLPADTTAYEHIAFLPARLNARYVLQACKGSDCVDSNVVHVAGNVVDAIGYAKASNTAASMGFGYSVAISANGSTLAVGAPYESSQAWESGAAYVFIRTAGVWRQQALLKASNAGFQDRFGGSVALSANGDVLAVGAYYQGAQANGAAYVFARQGGSWNAGIPLAHPDPVPYSRFGYALALSPNGHRLAVGAPEDEGRTGTVQLYEDSSGSWQWTTTLRASNPGPLDLFGLSIALSHDGSTVAVGARNEDSNATGIGGSQGDGAPDSGAVYVFTLESSGWLQQAYVKASNAQPNDLFGQSVALSADGNTLAVGALFRDTQAIDSGAVYLFSRQGSQWSERDQLQSPSPLANARFGFAVALSSNGDTLAVGAPQDGSGSSALGAEPPTTGIADSGTAFVYQRTGSGWLYRSYAKAPNAESGPFFGGSLALSGDGRTLAVTAADEDSGATGVGPAASDDNAPDSGAVYLY